MILTGPQIDEEPLWCKSRAIVGVKAFKDILFKVLWAKGEYVQVDAKLNWAPSIGWVFCCICSGTLLPIILLLALVRPEQEEDRYIHRYSYLVNDFYEGPYDF